MYLEYFALKRHPFRITPDPTLFFPGGGRGAILEALIYAITTGEGIIKVVGEVGSGKTMLCRILEERLPESIEIVYLANPSLSPRDILYAIAFELQLPVTVETGRLLVMQHLQTYLLGQHGANRSVVVFIEEAQSMPMETLEEIRLLSNLETHRHKLLQIVLFGQPELEKNLRKRTIRQLRERITQSFHLEPLTTAEVGEYIRFRLQAAGCGKSGVFDSRAGRLIARASCGLIRRINILADKAMLAAYADPDAGALLPASQAMVHSRHARAAIRDSDFGHPFSRPAWALGLGVLLLVLVSVAVSGWYLFDAGAVLQAFSPRHPVSVSDLQVQSRFETVQAKGGDPASLPPAQRPVPEKPAGMAAQEATSPLTATGPAPAPPEEQPAAPLTSGLSPSRAAQPSQDSHPQTEASAQNAPSAQPPAAAVKPEKSLLELRREATAHWLHNVRRDDFTVQLMAVDAGNDTEMENFFQQISPLSLLDKIYVCPVRRGGHDVWLVVYNSFQGASSARRAIEVLPQELRRFQPFVRRLGELLRGSQPDDAHP